MNKTLQQQKLEPKNIKVDRQEEDTTKLPSEIDLICDESLPEYPRWRSGIKRGFSAMILALLISFIVPLPANSFPRWQLFFFSGISAFAIFFAVAAFRPETNRRKR